MLAQRWHKLPLRSGRRLAGIDIEAAKREFQAVAASPKAQEAAEGFFGAVQCAC